MEGEVCMYQKYGFCKYKENCTKKHLNEECKDPKCKSKGSCDKRHPKLCKRYIQEKNCPYGETCGYLHREKEKSPEEKKLMERIEQLEAVVKEKSTAEMKMEEAVRGLEKVVKAMSRKVIHLEEEIINIKDNSKINVSKELFKDKSQYKSSTPVSENKRPTLVDNQQKEYKKVSNVSEIVEKKDVEGIESKAKAAISEVKQSVLSCHECDYVAKKEKFLNKHILTKHQDHICKECKEKYQTFMELLKHVANHHSSEPAEEKDVEGEVDPNIQKEE